MGSTPQHNIQHNTTQQTNNQTKKALLTSNTTLKTAMNKETKKTILLLLLIASVTLGQNTTPMYGALSNFDVINTTGQQTCGFEIELDGVDPASCIYFFGAPWSRYGNPYVSAKVDGTGATVGAYIRYESTVDTTTNPPTCTIQTAAIDPSVVIPTGGHDCYRGGPIGNYDASGCEHFGISLLNGNPTNVVYHWLVLDAASGGLVQDTTRVPVPPVIVAPVANNVAAAPVVQAVVNLPVIDVESERPPQGNPVAQACAFYGPATWIKLYVKELESHVDLDSLLSDDPAGVVPHDSAEVEIEWQLAQSRPTCAESEGDGGVAVDGTEKEWGVESSVNGTNKAVSRRYEFFEYKGDYDPETNEAITEPVGDVAPAWSVGNYLGSQMVAANIIDVLSVTFATECPLANIDSLYAFTVDTDMAGGLAPFQFLIADGALPDGLSLDVYSGEVTGTPTTEGDYTFTVAVIDTAAQTMASDWLTISVGPVNLDSPTPSPTTSTSRSSSRTPSASVSPSLSRSPSQSRSISRSSTISRSASASRTISPSASGSRGPLTSISVSPIPATVSPASGSISVSPSKSSQLSTSSSSLPSTTTSPSSSASPSKPASLSSSASASLIPPSSSTSQSGSQTPSPTSSTSPTPSATRSASASVSRVVPSSSPSSSSSATPSSSSTPSSSVSASSSATRSTSISASISNTRSSSASVSPTASRTASASVSATKQPSASLTASQSPSASITATKSRSASVSATASASASRSGSPTRSVSLTASKTRSASVSVTPTRSASATATRTRSASPSASASRPPTPSQTPSRTRSASASPSKASPSRSPSPSV
eukprot:c10042_g1_i2.p1 GENE.c10042_g1_i2~~c10042_g1_i2.p1  ORF type:complete len:829 (-),score=224.77 c10042_g1_i2:269-2755(-)